MHPRQLKAMEQAARLIGWEHVRGHPYLPQDGWLRYDGKFAPSLEAACRADIVYIRAVSPLVASALAAH